MHCDLSIRRLPQLEFHRESKLLFSEKHSVFEVALEEMMPPGVASEARAKTGALVQVSPSRLLLPKTPRNPLLPLSSTELPPRFFSHPVARRFTISQYAKSLASPIPISRPPWDTSFPSWTDSRPINACFFETSEHRERHRSRLSYIQRDTRPENWAHVGPSYHANPVTENPSALPYCVGFLCNSKYKALATGGEGNVARGKRMTTL
jgi:hypothetical protein